MRSKLWPRLASLLLFVALVAILTHFGLILFAPRPLPVPQQAPTSPTALAATDIGPAALLFGALPSGAASLANVSVLGVIAQDGGGSAVLSVDGKPGRAFPLGREVAPGIVLAEIRGTGVVLDRGGVRSEIMIPKMPASDFFRKLPSP